MATNKPVKKSEIDVASIEINIDEIHENPNNPRSRIDNVDDLKASIKAHGLMQPIVVRILDDYSYEVVAGSRRFQACKEIGLEKIPCTVLQNIDDEKAFELATAENVVRENMSAVDEANAVAKLFAQGKSRTEIGAMFGKSARWAEGRRCIVELGDKAMNYLAAGKINLGHAEVLTMCRKEDVEKYLGYATWKTPEELKTYIMNKKPLLERAPFDAKKACKNCENRSDCQRDLFGDVQNSYCLDRECFEGKVKKKADHWRKKFIKDGLEEVPEDDYYDAQNGWNGYICTDSDDEVDNIRIKKLVKQGAKPKFWVDDKTAEWGMAYLDTNKKKDEDDDNDDDDESSTPEDDSWHSELSLMKYERNEKIKELANEEEKHILHNKLPQIFGTMRNETKAFILEMLDRGIEDDEGNVKSYLEDFTQASVDFIDEICDHLVHNWSGVHEDVRKFFQMDSREEFERREHEALPEDWKPEDDEENKEED